MTHRYCLRNLLAAGALLVAAPAFGADADDLDALKREIAELLAKVETYSADLTTKIDMGSMAMNFGGTVRGKGDLFDTTTNINLFGQKMANRRVVDADGVSWHEMDIMGEKSVTKSPASELDSGDDFGTLGFGFGAMFGEGSMNPLDVLGKFEKSYTLTSAGKAMLDGVEVFVVEGVMSDDARRMLGVWTEEEEDEDADDEARTSAAEATDEEAVQIGGFEPEGFLEGILGGFDSVRLMLATADGFPRKIEVLARDGTPTLTQTYSNVLLNRPMDDSSFAYTPPDGVDVTDVTETGADFAGGDSSDLPSEEYNTKLKVGDAAPDFEGPGLDGKPVKLSDYTGKVVLLDFWATWCGPCVAEVPNVIAAYKEYHPKGLEIIGISLDEERADLDSFLADHTGMTWAQIFDGKGWEADVGALYGVDAIPLTLLLGKDGKIVGKDLRGGALKEAIAEALGE